MRSPPRDWRGPDRGCVTRVDAQQVVELGQRNGMVRLRKDRSHDRRHRIAVTVHDIGHTRFTLDRDVCRPRLVIFRDSRQLVVFDLDPRRVTWISLTDERNP